MRYKSAKQKEQSETCLCCNEFLLVIFKHLIHIFVVLIVVSFVGMLVIQETTDIDTKYVHEIDEEMDHVDWYISHHPWFYRLTKNLGLKELHNGLAKKSFDMALDQ